MAKKHHVGTQNIASLQVQNIPDLHVALTIAQQAALLARRIQANMISPALNKSDRSPVTVADFAVQALVARRLMLAFPNDPLVAEEDSSTLQTSPLLTQVTAFVSTLEPTATPQTVCAWIDRGGEGQGENGRDREHHSIQASAPTTPARYWLLDPIDGTKGFLRGGQYAVALTLMVDGRPQIGVLGCPELQMAFPDRDQKDDGAAEAVHGCLVFAVQGKGTWMAALEDAGVFNSDGAGSRTPLDSGGHLYVRLHVSRRRAPARARLLRSFEAGHTNVGQIDQFAASLGIRARPVLMDSQVKYAVLAAGQGDLIVRLLSPEKPDYREKAWDQAAGSLVVAEAGGCATDLAGKPFDFTLGRELIHNRGVLVSNGRLHEAALQALKTVGA